MTDLSKKISTPTMTAQEAFDHVKSNYPALIMFSPSKRGDRILQHTYSVNDDDFGDFEYFFNEYSGTDMAETKSTIDAIHYCQATSFATSCENVFSLLHTTKDSNFTLNGPLADMASPCFETSKQKVMAQMDKSIEDAKALVKDLEARRQQVNNQTQGFPAENLKGLEINTETSCSSRLDNKW
tara:strand:- start:1805 stop:2353 length:549 start_codon:yes stop_codon:yes gene_type:complete